jgi:cyanophycinase-like exopeptidase
MGPIGLHGGGEYEPGDEPFLRLLLDAAAVPAAGRGAGGPVRIAILPTAAAGSRPDLAAEHGVAAFGRTADRAGVTVRTDVVPVVDRVSAADPDLAALLAAADLIHLPGGNPRLVVSILGDSAAWAAVITARGRGAVLAGASAGAMALANWTWTPDGGCAGLGVVSGLVVVPHFERVPDDRWRSERESLGRQDLGLIGLDERTGILSRADEPDRPGRPWRVAGAGRATWLPPSAGDPIVARDGETITLSGGARAAV